MKQPEGSSVFLPVPSIIECSHCLPRVLPSAVSFKGFKYRTNHFNVHGFLTTIFHPFVASPSDVPGVFTSGDSK
jgi:hypothetical protein